MENDSLLINLKEIFLKAGLSEDKALSVYSEIILEQALQRSSLEEKIAEISRQLQNHVLKLLMFPDDNDNKNHWQTEVSNFANVFCGRKIKTKNGAKLPSIEKLLEWLEIYDEETMRIFCFNICSSYNRKIVYPSYEVFTKIMFDIASQKKPITMIDVENIIEKNVTNRF